MLMARFSASFAPRCQQTAHQLVPSFVLLNCEEGTVAFLLEIETGTRPEDIRWDLADDSGQILLDGGPHDFLLTHMRPS